MLQNEQSMNKKDIFHDYLKIFKELYLIDGLIMRGNKIIIPDLLRMQIIQAGHDVIRE